MQRLASGGRCRGKALALRAFALHWVDVTADAEGRRRVKLGPVFSCRSMCGITRAEPDGDMVARAENRCALPGFDPARWSNTPGHVEQYADELASILRARVDLDYDYRRDGCPWAWAHSRFAVGVAAHMGQRTLESRVRAPSLRLTRRMLRDADEPVDILDAVTQAEAFEDNALALYHEVSSS